MLSTLDHGIRCERHAGEIFPPRCYECSAAARAEDERTARERLSRPVQPAPRRRAPRLVECALHAGYYAYELSPCDRCIREASS